MKKLQFWLLEAGTFPFDVEYILTRQAKSLKPEIKRNGRRGVIPMDTIVSVTNRAHTSQYC